MPQGRYLIQFACECGTSIMWSGLDADLLSRKAITDEIRRHQNLGHQAVTPNEARMIRASEAQSLTRRNLSKVPRTPEPQRSVRVSDGKGRGAWHAVAQGAPPAGRRTVCGRLMPDSLPQGKGRARRALETKAEDLPNLGGYGCLVCLQRGTWPKA
jgi:hypothetical protein